MDRKQINEHFVADSKFAERHDDGSFTVHPAGWVVAENADDFSFRVEGAEDITRSLLKRNALSSNFRQSAVDPTFLAPVSVRYTDGTVLASAQMAAAVIGKPGPGANERYGEEFVTVGMSDTIFHKITSAASAYGLRMGEKFKIIDGIAWLNYSLPKGANAQSVFFVADQEGNTSTVHIGKVLQDFGCGVAINATVELRLKCQMPGGASLADAKRSGSWNVGMTITSAQVWEKANVEAPSLAQSTAGASKVRHTLQRTGATILDYATRAIQHNRDPTPRSVVVVAHPEAAPAPEAGGDAGGDGDDNEDHEDDVNNGN